MGNICQSGQLIESTKSQTAIQNNNTIVCEFEINHLCALKLIVGSYRYHQADLLLVFDQIQDIEYSSEIKDYAQNYLELIEKASLRKKLSIFIQIEAAPINDLLQFYCQDTIAFNRTLITMLSTCSQFTLQICQTGQNGKGIPNQTLISLFIKHLQTYDKPILIYLISTEMKLINMVRYEMAKLGKYIPLVNKIKSS